MEPADSSIEILDVSIEPSSIPTVSSAAPNTTSATASPSPASAPVLSPLPAQPNVVPKVVSPQPTSNPPVPAVTPRKSSGKPQPPVTSPNTAPAQPKPAQRTKSPVPVEKGIKTFEMADGELYETPWRPTVNWSNVFETEAELKDEIENYEPLGDMLTDEVQFPRVNILLFGGVGAGKSSVFNTINSVFRGKIFNVARSGCTEHSLTTKFTQYPIMSGSSTLPMPMKFRICDIRGLEQEHLMTKENMRYILEGNIADRFPLDPSGNISADMPGFKKHPDLHERIHCVAIVQDASIVDAMQDLSPEVTKNIKDMQTIINSLDIPQVVVLTKIDSICEDTKNETSNAFRSPKVEKCVAKVAEVLGLPRNSVYPMKNYEAECQLDKSINIMSLLTLKGILTDCDAHLFTHYDEILKNYRVADRRNP